MVAGVRMTMGCSLFADTIAAEDDYVVAELRKAGHRDHRQDRDARSSGCRVTPRPRSGRPRGRRGTCPGRRAGRAAARPRRWPPGLAPAAQGSDGGGSIRIPASVCGLFGIKPSRGRISGGPLMPDLSGLSTDGPHRPHRRRRRAPARRDDGQSPGRHVHAAAAARRRDLPRPCSPGARQAADRAVADQRRRRAPPCTTTASRPTRTASSCSPSSGTRSRTSSCRSARTPCRCSSSLWYSMATLAPIDPAQEGRAAAADPLPARQRPELTAADLIFAQAYLQGGDAAGPARC